MNCRCCSNSLSVGWPVCIYKQCNSQAEVKHLWTTLQKRLHLLHTSLRMGSLWECHWVNFKQKHPHSSSSPGGLSQGWRPLFWELSKRGFISPGEQQIEKNADFRSSTSAGMCALCTLIPEVVSFSFFSKCSWILDLPVLALITFFYTLNAEQKVQPLRCCCSTSEQKTPFIRQHISP